jgi:hypothetical protein
MVVLKIVENSNQETMDAILYLLSKAQKGGLSLSATFKCPGEEEEALTTGAYRARPELAVMAALRLSTRLLKAKPRSDR